MLEVLYSDTSVAVIVKPVGLISEDGAAGESVCPLIRETLGVSEVYPVHRLDRAVGGIMVYALNKKAAAALSQTIAENRMKKVYLAVVHGIPEPSAGEYSDLLFKDARKNKTYVVTRERKGVKRASLAYETLASADGLSLVRVILHTGRSHQIRVQFASRKMPLLGDGKYGAVDHAKEIALFSHALTFAHPVDGREIHFSALPHGSVWRCFTDRSDYR